MDKKEHILVKIILVLIGIPVAGFTLMTLWSWFIVPVFSLPPINFWEALGLDFTISYVIPPYVVYNSQKQAITEVITKVIAVPLFVLLCCYIIHLFV